MYNEQSLLDQCHPIFKPQLQAILKGLRERGWQPKIAELKRTSNQQADKVASGNSKTMASWHVASTIGRLPSGKGHVLLVHGNAADVVDARYAWGGPAAKHSFAFWKDLGMLAAANCCEWGGNWKKFPDPAHVQSLFIESPAVDRMIV